MGWAAKLPIFRTASRSSARYEGSLLLSRTVWICRARSRSVAPAFSRRMVCKHLLLRAAEALGLSTTTRHASAESPATTEDTLEGAGGRELPFGRINLRSSTPLSNLPSLVRER